MDEELQQLAQDIQKCQQSCQKTKLLNKMIRELQNANCLYYDHNLVPDYLRGCYDEIKAEAQQKLFCWITKNIDDYDSNRATLRTWLNHKLRFLMLDVIRDFKNNNLKEVSIFSLEDLDKQKIQSSKSNESKLFLSEQVIKVIQEDPERIFQITYTGKNPQANFQFICLERYQGYSWQEISNKLKILIPTLSNFYQRKLKEFAPLIQTYLQE